MPTDDLSTQVADASTEAHQTTTDSQDATAHPAQTEKNAFDARKAFDATNQRLNKIAEAIEGIQGAKKAVKKADDQPNVAEVVQRELWKSQNQSRIAKANADGKYDEYVSLGYYEDHALRLAEQDAGIQVDTSAQEKQRAVSTASSTVDRSVEPEMPDSLRGIMTPEEFKRIAARAAKVQIIR